MNHMGITEAELHAFIDGELEDQRTEAVAGLIDADPFLRKRCAAFAADRERLNRIYAPLADEPLPARLLRPLMVAPAPAPRRAAWSWAAAGGALAAAATILIMLNTGGSSGGAKDALLAEAMAVRDGAEVPERQLSADASMTSGGAVMEKALSSPVSIPDLGQEGYKLADLAVYTDHDSGRAVQISYRDDKGHRLTVYLHHPTGADRYEILPERNGRRVCIVENQELSRVMIGEMSEQQMLRIASLSYDALRF
jgi:anti-sigma factor RsiW